MKTTILVLIASLMLVACVASGDKVESVAGGGAAGADTMVSVGGQAGTLQQGGNAGSPAGSGGLAGASGSDTGVEVETGSGGSQAGSSGTVDAGKDATADSDCLGPEWIPQDPCADGKDNDCDGVIDEFCDGPKCGIATCQKNQVCMSSCINNLSCYPPSHSSAGTGCWDPDVLGELNSGSWKDANCFALATTVGMDPVKFSYLWVINKMWECPKWVKLPPECIYQPLDKYYCCSVNQGC